MTDAITPVAALPAGDASLPERPSPATADKQVGGTHLEVSREQGSPVVVYRLLDNDTGRTLAELPDKAPNASTKPGSVIDTWA